MNGTELALWIVVVVESVVLAGVVSFGLYALKNIGDILTIVKAWMKVQEDINKRLIAWINKRSGSGLN